MFEQSNTGTKLTGFYRGIVKAHCDAGRCKIFWPGVSPTEFENDPDSLPDAEQASPLFAAAKQDEGMFFYPNIDSIVWGFFENGDINFPVYFASAIGAGDMNTEAVYGSEVMANKIEKASNGKDAYRTAVLRLGTLQITFNGESSSIEIKSTIDQSENKDGTNETVSTISFDKEGISIKSNKNISIEANSVDVKASSYAKVSSPITVDISAGGLDEEGKSLPGVIYLNSNTVDIWTTRGGTFISGDEQHFRVI